jgi:hypothetical protein
MRLILLLLTKNYYIYWCHINQFFQSTGNVSIIVRPMGAENDSNTYKVAC